MLCYVVLCFVLFCFVLFCFVLSFHTFLLHKDTYTVLCKPDPIATVEVAVVEGFPPHPLFCFLLLFFFFSSFSTRVPPLFSPFLLCVSYSYVYLARSLAKRDVIGSSDPYVTIAVENTKEQTDVIHNNLNPKWNKSFTL